MCNVALHFSANLPGGSSSSYCYKLLQDLLTDKEKPKLGIAYLKKRLISKLKVADLDYNQLHLRVRLNL